MRIKIGSPELSPCGGYRNTYLEYPDNSLLPQDPTRLVLELSIGVLGVDGYRLITEEPDGSIVQEFDLSPDAAYELFLAFQKQQN